MTKRIDPPEVRKEQASAAMLQAIGGIRGTVVNALEEDRSITLSIKHEAQDTTVDGTAMRRREVEGACTITIEIGKKGSAHY